MRILVTGATGFVGRNLLPRLLTQHHVIALTRPSGARFSQTGVETLPLDLSQFDERLLPEQVDVIVHLAQANVSFPEGAERLLAVNTIATQRLLEYAQAARATRFVLASTGDVYGDRLEPAKESDEPAPASFYTLTKLAAEMITHAYAGRIQVCILRLFTPYGPGQTNRLIPKLADRIQSNQPVQLNEQDRPHLTPMFIRDVVTAMERAITSSYAGTLNICGDNVVSFRELCNEIGSTLKIEPVFEQTYLRRGDLIGNNSLMKEVLGDWPQISLAEGLARTFKSKEDTRWRVHV